MTLDVPIETTGFFWLPEEPEDRLSGHLKISESGEITVELSGTFGGPLVALREMGISVTPPIDDALPSLERMVGILDNGTPVTMDGCFWQTLSLELSSELSRSIAHVDFALIGAGYGEQEQVSFSEVSFSVYGLDAWLSVSGIEVEPDVSNKSGVIRFHLPDEIPLTLPNGVGLTFAFNLTSPMASLPITEAGVRQTASVFLSCEEPHSISYFSRLAVRLCNFLSFALDQAVYIQSTTGYLEEETANGQKRRKPVRVYRRYAHWPDSKRDLRPHHALFRYPDVADRLDDVITKWFESYGTFEPAFDLYFASRVETSVFLDAKVLWIAQALEALHRRGSQETAMCEDEFRNLIELVSQSCPEDRREWLAQKLRYANELTFMRRVRELVDPFKRWFGSSGERSKFISRVSDTRNYLTHFDEETTKNRAVGVEELFALHEKMEALFQLHLLNQVGFDDSSISSLVQRTPRLRRKLGS